MLVIDFFYIITVMKLKAIIFDVNETLLNMQKLREEINRVLDNSLGFQVWFDKLLHYSLVGNETDTHNDFSEIAKAVFKMTADFFGKNCTEYQINSTLSLVSKLPAYKDVSIGLQKLKDQNLKLIALTNGNRETLEAQLSFAEIDNYFDAVYSVDVVGKFKPHTITYQKVLNDHHLLPQETLMVTAHGWDIAGAAKAGLKTAFIERDGKNEYPLAKPADLSFKNIDELAEVIKNNA
ncbi:haloacid dehalogenase type II [Zunongwangia sp. HGR-M22]|uniref:haloacid dehalogenase type II n=1 Tax=Zunongwangia sp. HGR-M22 TaxID=3015168 RepID=UPI0022DD0118|nr:haloacid dehalogenase type II [Zunongwangia sp. HGR-M22]WBL25896.1 haloacid dehalogenase type II [Zunongwangia sp. HGR-M22]